MRAGEAGVSPVPHLAISAATRYWGGEEVAIMDDAQLENALKSMGKTCFVKYFSALSDEYAGAND